MCEICGCDSGAKVTATNLQTGEVILVESASSMGEHVHVRPDGTRYVHSHALGGGHSHGHGDTSHGHDTGPLVEIGARVLAKNDALAARNRAWLAENQILALNLMSAPGAGKTTLLERTIRDMKTERPLCVLEGDQATSNDGERIRAAGAAVVQLNTGTGCHLDAQMVARGLQQLAPPKGALVVVENVGNLVCPALFDIGEHRRVVILSVTEGEDKPLKYPHMFRVADLVLLNKIDLLPYVDFDVSRATANARAVNPDVTVMHVSARTGEGLDAWYRWMTHQASRDAGKLTSNV